MKNALKAGFYYFILVFGAGFVLGTVRTLAITPNLGALPAVILELPLMLAVSWAACGWAIRRFSVPDGPSARLAMGASSFLLLIGGEILVSVLLSNRSPADHFALYRTLPVLLGLAGQIAYALFPLLRHRNRPFGTE